MTTELIVLTALVAVVALCTFAAFAWLFHMLRWEVVDDDAFTYHQPDQPLTGWAWAKFWLLPGPRMLTYRRDSRGRFRRHRR